ncbi:hypothetical protein AAG570_003598 [Ranatra chinensis]|uniref:Uncharacterized protein n=1 Tax=Ranatra chinensis TaxID=642074 RepID=A0ABD0Y452_9HEMI
MKSLELNLTLAIEQGIHQDRPVVRNRFTGKVVGHADHCGERIKGIRDTNPRGDRHDNVFYLGEAGLRDRQRKKGRYPVIGVSFKFGVKGFDVFVKGFSDCGDIESACTSRYSQQVTVVTMLALSSGCLMVMVVLGAAVGVQERPPCPDSCECHFFRINWITDCSDANLDYVPISGLSSITYALNLDGNNIASLCFPPRGLMVRRLLLEGNRITKVTRQQFLPLQYLIELDLSGNFIYTIEQDTFM